MLRNIIAIERDGWDFRSLSLQFDVPDKNFPLEQAIRDAVADFLRTPEGRCIYEYNCSSFNWGDVAMSLPQEVCMRHGFSMVDSCCEDLVVDWDEELYDETTEEHDDE